MSSPNTAQSVKFELRLACDVIIIVLYNNLLLDFSFSKRITEEWVNNATSQKCPVSESVFEVCVCVFFFSLLTSWIHQQSEHVLSSILVY